MPRNGVHLAYKLCTRLEVHIDIALYAIAVIESAARGALKVVPVVGPFAFDAWW